MIDTGKLTKEALDGEISSYMASYLIKEQLKIVKEHLEIVNTHAINESIYEEKTFKKDGFNMEKRNGRKVWNFKGCESYKIAKDKLAEIKNDLKDNYKQWEKGNTVTNEDGEILEIPEVTYTKDVLIIKRIQK
jgi:hypothetical protein